MNPNNPLEPQNNTPNEPVQPLAENQPTVTSTESFTSPPATPSVTPPIAPLAPATTVDGLRIDSIESPKELAAKKRAKFFFGSVVGLIILAAVGGVGYYLYSMPSKSDFASAQEVQATIQTTGDTLATQPADMSTLTVAESETITSDHQATLSQLDEKIEAFKSSKAMRNKEVAAAYDAFAAKYKKSRATLGQMITVYPHIIALRDDCGAMAGTDAQARLRSAVTNQQVITIFNEVTQPCIDAAATLKQSDMALLATYGGSIESAIMSLRADVVELAGARSSAAISAAQAKMQASQDKITSANSTVLVDIAKLSEEVSVGKELAALKDAISKAESQAWI